MSRRDRTGSLMEVELTKDGKTIQCDVWIPFTIFVNAIREYFGKKLVDIDGTDNAIWNSFVDLGAIDKFEDDEDFLELCRNAYKGTEFEEEDIEDNFIEEDE